MRNVDTQCDKTAKVSMCYSGELSSFIAIYRGAMRAMHSDKIPVSDKYPNEADLCNLAVCAEKTNHSGHFWIDHIICPVMTSSSILHIKHTYVTSCWLIHSTPPVPELISLLYFKPESNNQHKRSSIKQCKFPIVFH